MQPVPEHWLPSVIAIAREAGDAIMEVYGREFSIIRKADNSPLTEADLAAHRVIEDGLLVLKPALPVLSEESTEIPFEIRKQWSTYWLVDPLDGTREFVKRNGEFSVNIALIQDGRPILGVIYAPVLALLYFAAQGHGAFRQVDGEQATRRPGYLPGRWIYRV